MKIKPPLRVLSLALSTYLAPVLIIAQVGNTSRSAVAHEGRGQKNCNLFGQLIKDLGSSDRMVGIKASHSLNQYAPSCPAKPLLDALANDPNPHVRIGAAYAILQNPSVDAVPPLIDLLRTTQDEPEDNFPEYIIHDLGETHDIRAVPVLIEELRKEESFQVRTWTAHALGELKDIRAVEPLVLADAGSDGHHYRMADDALQPLVKIGPPAIPILMEMFRDPRYKDDREAKMVIADALGLLHDPVAIPLLYGMYESRDADFRYAADAALDRMDPTELQKWQRHRTETRIATGLGIAAIAITFFFGSVLLWRKRRIGSTMYLR